jgi:hypothetical protein
MGEYTPIYISRHVAQHVDGAVGAKLTPRSRKGLKLRRVGRGPFHRTSIGQEERCSGESQQELAAALKLLGIQVMKREHGT